MPPPTDERAVFGARLRTVLDRLAETVEAIPERHIDERVLADGNTPAIIVAHVTGSARGGVLAIGCGLEVDRDRVSEFAAEGGSPEVLAAGLRTLADELSAALLDVPPGRLDEVTTPPQAILGLVPQQEMARRAGVLSTIAHASEHLGELMFIKDTFAER
ncbi:MAG: DinB family protein [Dehalococcoidia bacterium]